MTILRLLPRFRRAYASLHTLAARETWSHASIQAFQLERLNALWRHAVSHVEYYRALAARLQLPRKFASLEEFRSTVPVLAKSTVRDEPHALLSAHAESGAWRQTSGSTGVPTGVFWSRRAHFEHLRCKYRHLQSWGLDMLDRTVYIWGTGTSFPPGIAGRLERLRWLVEDGLRNRLRLSAHDLSLEALAEYLQQIHRFRPASVYGFSSAIYLLSLAAAERNFTCDSLRLVTLTSELSPPAFVTAAERAFGVPALREYGSVECGTLANEAPDRTLRVRDDIVFMETLPRDDGLFDVVVTVLGNPSFPLIRYAIGDLTDAPLQRGDRGFAILSSLVGRDNDIIISRSGRALHSEPLDKVFIHDRAVRRWRIAQALDGSLDVHVEPMGRTSTFDAAHAREALGELVEGYPVRLAVVHAIPAAAAGKHRWISSELGRRHHDGRPSRA